MKTYVSSMNQYRYDYRDRLRTGGRRRSRQVALRSRFALKMFSCLFAGMVVFAVMLHFMTGPDSDAASVSHKVVSSVRIEPQDTLWSIAEEYYTQECGSMQEYIEEIKATNNLSGDAIHAGSYIIVPYYQLGD